MVASITSAMVVVVFSSPKTLVISSRSRRVITEHSNSKSTVNIICPIRNNNRTTRRLKTATSVTALSDDVASLADPAQAVITWQIVVGAFAGVMPFVVAGIEFSKRIIAQRRCGVCGGSGLVLRDSKYYFRCPNCGGFLPWQSWKRFFSG